MMMFAMVMVIILTMRSTHYSTIMSTTMLQVRLTHQFEEGVTIGVHLVSAPKKAKLNPGGFR